MDLEWRVVDPRSEEVRRLLEAHLDFARRVTPEGHVHALDLDGLLQPEVTLYAGLEQGEVVCVGALKLLVPGHGELKSMHVRVDRRGRGIGRALVGHLLAEARRQGMSRVSLETGTMEAFAPARRLYTRLGFVPCPPFGPYTANPYSVCMTLDLTQPT